MIKYLWQDFKRKMKDERGFIQALAFLANPAFWAGVGNVMGGVGAMAGGGGGNQAQPIASSVPSANYLGGSSSGMGGGNFEPPTSGLGEKMSLGGANYDVGQEGGKLSADRLGEASKTPESTGAGSSFMKDIKSAVASKVASAVVDKILSGGQNKSTTDQAPMAGQIPTQTPSATGMGGAIGFQTPEMQAQIEARRRMYGY